jgi:hypothetical protein
MVAVLVLDDLDLAGDRMNCCNVRAARWGEAQPVEAAAWREVSPSLERRRMRQIYKVPTKARSARRSNAGSRSSPKGRGLPTP